LQPPKPDTAAARLQALLAKGTITTPGKGKTVAFTTPIEPGDIVTVETTRDPPGPDQAWTPLADRVTPPPAHDTSTPAHVPHPATTRTRVHADPPPKPKKPRPKEHVSHPATRPDDKRLLTVPPPPPETLLNTKVIDEICQALKAGAFIECAVAHAGVPKKSYYDWMSKAARGKGSHLERLLSDSVKQALADGELMHVLNIAQAAKSGAWQASAWMLERKFPNRWGRRIGLEHTGAGGGPIQLEERRRTVVAIMADPKLTAAAALLAESVIDISATSVDDEQQQEIEE